MLCMHCGKGHSSSSRRCKGDKTKNIYSGPSNAPHAHDWHMLEWNIESDWFRRATKFICLTCDEVKEIK